ncbi:hypothetical protein [Xenorhabdus sp. PB62.4]|uniref:hypothetical protein n=1 Tax=Xenorhabdus sp. PB62.4 TaxID=1851573 RepID=UPI001656DF7A|nr:hypothetical protein [Xenorhabdus sp. PB62.4]
MDAISCMARVGNSSSVVKKEMNITTFRNRVTACYANLPVLKGTQGEAYLRNRAFMFCLPTT